MRSIKITFCFLFSLFINACSEKGDLIKDADRIEFLCDNGNELYKHQETSKSLIKDFRKILNGKGEKRKCSPIGKIGFYKNSRLLLETGFSISDDECQFIMIDEKAWRLSYNTGMYLSETFAELKGRK